MGVWTAVKAVLPQTRPAFDCTPRNAGFAAVDALVALAILTTTIALSLEALAHAREASGRAGEIRAAIALLKGALALTPAKAGHESGRTDGFDWSIDTSARRTGQAGLRLVICDRNALASPAGTKRQYALATTEPCVPDPVL